MIRIFDKCAATVRRRSWARRNACQKVSRGVRIRAIWCPAVAWRILRIVCFIVQILFKAPRGPWRPGGGESGNLLGMAFVSGAFLLSQIGSCSYGCRCSGTEVHPWGGGTSRSHNRCYNRLGSMFRCSWKRNLTRTSPSKAPKWLDSLLVLATSLTKGRSYRTRRGYRYLELP